MSAVDGGFVCDRCGSDVGGGGVTEALIIGDLDPDDPGKVRNLHFCRKRTDAAGREIAPCASYVITPTNLADLNSRKNKAKKAAATTKSTRKTTKARSTK